MTNAMFVKDVLPIEGNPDAVLEYRHVKGHTRTKDGRSYVNRWCDKAAKRHMRKQREKKHEKPKPAKL